MFILAAHRMQYVHIYVTAYKDECFIQKAKNDKNLHNFSDDALHK